MFKVAIAWNTLNRFTSHGPVSQILKTESVLLVGSLGMMLRMPESEHRLISDIDLVVTQRAAEVFSITPGFTTIKTVWGGMGLQYTLEGITIELFTDWPFLGTNQLRREASMSSNTHVLVANLTQILYYKFRMVLAKLSADGHISEDTFKHLSDCVLIINTHPNAACVLTGDELNWLNQIAQKRGLEISSIKAGV